MIFMYVVMSIASIWMVTISLMVKTNNLLSVLIYKVAPMLLGVIQGAWCLKQFGIL